MNVSFLDLYNHIGPACCLDGETISAENSEDCEKIGGTWGLPESLGCTPCGDCPIEGGCNGSFIEDVVILEGETDCHCESFYEGVWSTVQCPYIPCSKWSGPGTTYEWLHCGDHCVETNPDECFSNEGGVELCGPECPCATPHRLICGEDSTGCRSGAINRKCCSRLHVYYGAYHDGEKYWLSDNPMRYFPAGPDPEEETTSPGINCKRQCGAATLSTAPVCQGETKFHCPDLEPSMWCSPVGCCEENDSDCGNCPHCASPEDAPFCCRTSPTHICDFHEQQDGSQGEIDNWQDWCVNRHGQECLLDYEPFYWKFCGIGGWGLSPGDGHVDRMYRIDEEEDSPTFNQRIPCNDNQDCGNSALYDIYDLTGGGGGVEAFVPHVLILYAEHIRAGSIEESKSSYVVKGWWVSCTSNDNSYNLPAIGSDPDCHCPDSPTAQIGACCTGDGFCQDLTESECNNLNGEWGAPNTCVDDPC